MIQLTALTGLICLLHVAAAAAVLPRDTPVRKLPAGVPPKITMNDKPSDPAGKLVKIRYGPYTLPPHSMIKPNWWEVLNIQKPCDECYIGAMQGDLEYADGSTANINTGPYLHHLVLSNDGKTDMVCNRKFPVLGGGGRRQWIFSGNNERAPVRLNAMHKFGMRVDKTDTFSAIAEFENMSAEPKTVFATIIYEVVPLGTPGYREATHTRVDLTECGDSEVPAKQGVYEYHSQEWATPYAGVILHNDGHAHPGATNVKLLVNGQVVCDSVQYYGLGPEWIRPADMAVEGEEMGMDGMQFISDTVACENFGRVEKGDRLQSVGVYDSGKYPQMTEVTNGKRLQTQMAISFLYIGRDEDTLNDTIPGDTNGVRYPIEMNYTAPFGLSYLTVSELTGLEESEEEK